MSSSKISISDARHSDPIKINSAYIVRSPNGVIHVDTSKGPVKIILPSLVVYDSKGELHVEKVSNDNNYISFVADGDNIKIDDNVDIKCIGVINRKAVLHFTGERWISK